MGCAAEFSVWVAHMKNMPNLFYQCLTADLTPFLVDWIIEV